VSEWEPSYNGWVSERIVSATRAVENFEKHVVARENAARPDRPRRFAEAVHRTMENLRCRVVRREERAGPRNETACPEVAIRAVHRPPRPCRLGCPRPGVDSKESRHGAQKGGQRGIRYFWQGGIFGGTQLTSLAAS
jgi:hypothetical protein